jgi:hypothetical protein
MTVPSRSRQRMRRASAPACREDKRKKKQISKHLRVSITKTPTEHKKACNQETRTHYTTVKIVEEWQAVLTWADGWKDYPGHSKNQTCLWISTASANVWKVSFRKTHSSTWCKKKARVWTQGWDYCEAPFVQWREYSGMNKYRRIKPSSRHKHRSRRVMGRINVCNNAFQSSKKKKAEEWICPCECVKRAVWICFGTERPV